MFDINIFVLGMVVYVVLLVTIVGIIAYLLFSPPKKKRRGRHLRRRGVEQHKLKDLVHRYRHTAEEPKEWRKRKRLNWKDI